MSKDLYLRRMKYLPIPGAYKDSIARIKSYKDKLSVLLLKPEPRSEIDNWEIGFWQNRIVDLIIVLPKRYHKYIDMSINVIQEK
jgi:hypothetical protein